MNLVEVYVTKIYKETVIQKDFGTLYELVVDTDCFGQITFRDVIRASESDYKMIKEKGYYLA